MANEFDSPQPDLVSRQARKWIVRIASGGMTESEAVRFKAWLRVHPRNRQAFKRERRFWQELEALKDVFQQEKVLGPPRLASVPTPNANADSEGPREFADAFVCAPPSRSGKRWVVGGWLAACLALFVVWTQFGVVWFADHRTREGELRKVGLPDGSMAHLNTATAINVRYENGMRRIDLLEGEAFFDVRPDASAPFRVTTGDGVVEVLGTRFGVSEHRGGMEVTVVSGEVAVFASSMRNVPASENAEAVRLTAGERIAYVSGAPSSRVQTVDAKSALPWTRGTLRIDGMPFADAIQLLDRYRPGRVLVWGKIPDAQPVSGVFHVNQIDRAIAALASTQNLTVTHVTDYLVVLR